MEELNALIAAARAFGIVVNPGVALVAGLAVAWVRKKTTMGDPTKAARRSSIALTWGIALVLVILLDLAGRGDQLVWTVKGTAEALLSWMATAMLAAGGAATTKGIQGK